MCQIIFSDGIKPGLKCIEGGGDNFPSHATMELALVGRKNSPPTSHEQFCLPSNWRVFFQNYDLFEVRSLSQHGSQCTSTKWNSHDIFNTLKPFFRKSISHLKNLFSTSEIILKGHVLPKTTFNYSNNQGINRGYLVNGRKSVQSVLLPLFTPHLAQNLF